MVKTDAKVTVYSTKTCPYCKMAKQFLDANGVKYGEIDVGTDEKAAKDMVERSGQMGVPVIDIDGKLIVGFDKQAMKEALQIA